MHLTLTLDLSKLTLAELAAVVLASQDKLQALTDYFHERKREHEALQLRRRDAPNTPQPKDPQ